MRSFGRSHVTLYFAVACVSSCVTSPSSMSSPSACRPEKVASSVDVVASGSSTSSANASLLRDSISEMNSSATGSAETGLGVHATSDDAPTEATHNSATIFFMVGHRSSLETQKVRPTPECGADKTVNLWQRY
ncbi:exported hypothetical protein [Corynebacterium striatum]|nr:exported hypothetical protein [Corynebacterium striatum]